MRKERIKGPRTPQSASIEEITSVEKSLRILPTKRPSLKTKKKLLQSGGFLGALLTPVLSFLGGLVSQAAAQ
jgi:hypothetical protein